MALMDFASRLLGYNPFDTQNSNAPVSGQQASTAAIAQPTLGQMYQDDLRQAQFDKLGNLGMLLLASSQQLTPSQRATILAQAPQYMDGAQRDAMTAAQARLMNMQGKATQDEMTRADALRQRFNDPNFVKSLGLSQDQAQALGPAGIQKLLENQAMANTPENILDRQYKQAQIDTLKGPKIGPVGQDTDGNTIYGDQRTGMPINIPATMQPQSGQQSEIPAGVNLKEYRKQQAQEAAKSAAANATQQKYIEEQFNPAAKDYDAAVREGIQGGAFGPLQANDMWRSITSNSDKEALRQRVEQAEKRMAFELAKRAGGGKLDSKGLTDTELEQYRKQLIPLYSSNPQMLLDSFEKNYGIQPKSTPQAGDVPRGVTIRRLGD